MKIQYIIPLLMMFFAAIAVSNRADGAIITIQKQGHIEYIYVYGKFVEVDYFDFYDLATKNPHIKEVRFNSPGGNAETGRRMGKFIKGRKMRVRVDRTEWCVSACAYAFLGGVHGGMSINGLVGFHMPRLPEVWKKKKPKNLIERTAIKNSQRDLNYFLTMGWSLWYLRQQAVMTSTTGYFVFQKPSELMKLYVGPPDQHNAEAFIKAPVTIRWLKSKLVTGKMMSKIREDQY